MNVMKTLFGNQSNFDQMMKDNKEDIKKANKRMLGWLLMLGFLCCTLLFIMTFIADDYAIMKVTYGGILLLLLCVLLINRYIKIATLPLIYGSYTILMGVAIYASAFLIRDNLCILALMILFQLPIVILDSSKNIHILEGTFLSIYIIFSVLFKDQRYLIDECVSTIIASIMGVILGAHLRYAQVENFNFKRLAIIQESIDALTGLNNRRKLFDVLENSDKNITGVMMLDIDDFKAYNDTYGHQAGDKCLIKVSQLISKFNNNIDFFRYGGEEFIGIAYHMNSEQLIKVAKQCVYRVEELQIEHKEAKNNIVTVSLGLYIVENQISHDEMIYKADTALYIAKHKGKNQVQVYSKKTNIKKAPVSTKD